MKKGNQFVTDLYVKLTDTYQYLHCSFYQKLMFYFHFNRLLKNLNQGQYGLTHTVLLKKMVKHL